MEFDKSKVYTSVNADELKIGSKCIFADSLSHLKKYVSEDYEPDTLIGVYPENSPIRFEGKGEFLHLLAYLVGPPEPELEEEEDY